MLCYEGRWTQSAGLSAEKHTHTRLTARFFGTTQVSRYQKGKTNLDFLLKQETAQSECRECREFVKMFQREVTSAVEPAKRWTLPRIYLFVALQEFCETYLYRQMMMITRTISNSTSSTKPTMIPIMAPAAARRRLFIVNFLKNWFDFKNI